jgi:hypothetical protein
MKLSKEKIFTHNELINNRLNIGQMIEIFKVEFNESFYNSIKDNYFKVVNANIEWTNDMSKECINVNGEIEYEIEERINLNFTNSFIKEVNLKKPFIETAAAEYFLNLNTEYFYKIHKIEKINDYWKVSYQTYTRKER